MALFGLCRRSLCPDNSNRLSHEPAELRGFFGEGPPDAAEPAASGCGVVLLGRIELPTSALPRMRSTTELQQLEPQA